MLGVPLKRRGGVSAESQTTYSLRSQYTPPIHPKEPQERQQLAEIIRTSPDGKLHMLFDSVGREAFERIIDAMFRKTIDEGQDVLVQGETGDFFYIVKSGKFDIFVRKGDEPSKKVFEASKGFAFGELALLYNAPRTATITATELSEVWCLERLAFHALVVQSSRDKFAQNMDFLKKIDIFQELDGSQLAMFAEVLGEEEFADDEAIIEQGEKDDKMFIVQSGSAVACIKGDQGEVEVMQYHEGDYFGEISLLSGEPRKASIYATGPCTCLYITKDTFVRILGPLHHLLEKNIEKYAKYADAIKACCEEADEEGTEVLSPLSYQKGFLEDEVYEASKNVAVRLRRVRQSVKIVKACNAGSLDRPKDLPVEKPEQTLAEKVLEDFSNPALVTPVDEFLISDSPIFIYGGLAVGQKFTDNKVIHASGSVEKVPVGPDDTYSWQAEMKLTLPTSVAVICQKGQKAAFDPTPNQDNYFVNQVGTVMMYGVVDGHGPFGHLVSFRLVQSLPYLLKELHTSGKPWDEALREAFLAAEDDLETFAAAQDINITASGAAGSVLIHDDQTIHIAHIGDARIMLASWNRRDSRLIFCTQDHVPQLPIEKARLEAAGMEVRELDPDTYRIYSRGTNIPGLTMSRAFGDTMCAGLLREPEYSKFLMQPSDEWYAIIASDGIWEFLDGEQTMSFTNKKLRLKGPRETLHFLVNASRKRWAVNCNDYCDDITGILVQWNSHHVRRDGDFNNFLTVLREGHIGTPE